MKRSVVRFMSFAIISILLALALLPAAGCKKSLLNSKQPVTLSMWHNYGGQMKNLMDEMIDEFNATVGAERGIIISVTAISGSSELHDMLTAAAEELPGALPLPDITTSYPKTAVLLKQHEMLVDLDAYFDKNKLDEYVPAFIDEGRIGGEGLYVFPIAKSTEVLFVNQTLFDRFAAENEIGYEDLSTFEGIAAASLTYLDWTDRQTPDIPGDGKSFFMADSLFNQALVGSKQLNEKFLLLENENSEYSDARLNISSPAHSRIWNINYTPSVCGGFAAFDGYSSDLFKTGDLVCAVGSTAGVLFYPE
ncbi:MAG: extracellular solute-binding protein, partial [Clostridiaceae bacterium]|nr:extracellular solute-binding protein [Clostridiaceae bacterium]